MVDLNQVDEHIQGQLDSLIRHERRDRWAFVWIGLIIGVVLGVTVVMLVKAATHKVVVHERVFIDGQEYRQLEDCR